MGHTFLNALHAFEFIFLFHFLCSQFKHSMIHSTPFFPYPCNAFPQHTKLFVIFILFSHLFKNIFIFFFSIIYVNLISRNSRFFVCIDFYCNFSLNILFFRIFLSHSSFYNNNGEFFFFY